MSDEVRRVFFTWFQLYVLKSVKRYYLNMFKKGEPFLGADTRQEELFSFFHHQMAWCPMAVFQY